MRPIWIYKQDAYWVVYSRGVRMTYVASFAEALDVMEIELLERMLV